MSLPYEECMRVYYSCVVCGKRPAPTRSVSHYGEFPSRLCDECYQKHLDEEAARENDPNRVRT